ncbi:MAG TPA: HNH endonuclease signature motif containing protein [Solirubrobacterales bacterium]|nr:HNH endonuclease signature motif containing protein [Solirubrobacterales bacterium]
MLVELNKFRLADELAGANESIVELLRKAATAEVVSYENTMEGWGHSGVPARKKVEAVLALPLADRVALASAVAADLRFESGSDRYEFAFFELSESARKAGKELMGSMYKDVFGGGSFVLGSGEEGSRGAWEDAFRAANPNLRVCPACLVGVLETRIEGRSAIDLDHYLPKSLYPPLSIHGPNLVPLCSRCNSRAKGEKDPLQDGDRRRRLASVWFPYAGGGLGEAHLAFEVDGDSHTTVRLQATGQAKQRAENFDALYLVSKLWSEQLEAVHNSLCSGLAARGARRGAALTVAEISDELAIKAIEKASTRLETSNAYLVESYCRWLLSDPVTVNAFAEAVQKFPPPPAAVPDPAL